MAGRLLRALIVTIVALATLVAAPAAVGAAEASDILRLDDFPRGWRIEPVTPSDSAAPLTPACAALAKQQRKSIATIGTPKFVDPRASSDLDVVAATVTTMASKRAAKEQVAALLDQRLLQCLVDATNARFEAAHGGAKASTVVRRIRIPRTDARVRAVEAKTRVEGVDGLVSRQQVVFVRDGRRIVTLHVDTDGHADYTALRNRLVPLVQRRLHNTGAVRV